MPERASYSLFPPADDILQRRQSRRVPRTRARNESAKRSLSAHSSPEDSSSLFEEQRTSTDGESLPASKSTDNLALEAKEERRQSILRTPSSSQPTSHRAKASPQLPTIYSPPPDSVQHPPAAPPPTKPLPSAPKPAPTVDTALKSTLKPSAPSNGSRHKRNLTNSSMTSTTKPSPITPESPTSAPSLFSPITPVSAGPSPVKYPNIPRLSSSPAPSVVEQASPPRRSHSRSTNQSQTTTRDLISSYAHTGDGSHGRSVAPGVRRAPSNAASSRTGQSTRITTTPRPSISAPSSQGAVARDASTSAAPIRSIFPTYKPDLPLSRPSDKAGRAPQFHLPAQRLEAKPYAPRASTPSLTKEALDAHNASSSDGESRAAGATESASQSQTATALFPPRSHSLPQNKGSAPSASSSAPQPAPTFPPPPRREASTKSSKSRAVLTKPKPPPKDEPTEQRRDRSGSQSGNIGQSSDAGLTGKEDLVREQREKKLDFQVAGKGSYTANTSATTKYDKEHNAVTTTATTTIVNVPVKNGPLHASSDYAAIIDGKEFSKDQVDVHHQHSVAVALGAMAFAMGVGVELVGGAVNGLTKGKAKGKKERKAVEAA